MDYRLIDINTIKTEDKGNLSFFEASRDIPFEIKRVYYVHGVDIDTERGGHAHKELEQLLWCPYGCIEIIIDDGINEKETVVLDNPSQGLYVPKLLYRDIIWQKKYSVLCVVASNYYDENDYIRNYNDFVEYIKGVK